VRERELGCLGCGGVVLVLAIIGSFLPDPPQTVNVPQKEVKPVTHKATQPSWAMVKEFTGRSTKNTQQFTVGNEWKIKWSTVPAQYGSGNFIVWIRNADDQIVGTAANVIGANTDESYFYEPGTYHLSVISQQNYTLQIWNNPSAKKHRKHQLFAPVYYPYYGASHIIIPRRTYYGTPRIPRIPRFRLR
jgi:hypothetical protein